MDLLSIYSKTISLEIVSYLTEIKLARFLDMV